MTQVFVGTAFHQVYCVPLDLKAPIVKLGEKKKSPVTSISVPTHQQQQFSPGTLIDTLYYSDERQSFEVNRCEENQIRSVEAPTILQQKQKVLSYEIFNGRQIYYTNYGNIYYPTQVQKHEKWSKLYYNEVYANILKSLPPQRAGRLAPEYCSVAVYNRNGNIQVGFAGRGVLPFVYEASQTTNSIAWRAKNVANDELDLEVPQNDVDLCFTNLGCNLVAANAENKIRVYDVKSRRRKPVTDVTLNEIIKAEKVNLSKMAKSTCENYLFLGNHRGSIYEVDLRKNMCVTGKFKGITTTVKDMQVHGQHLAVVSLDGYLRIFNTLTKQKQFQRYLNTHPSVLKLSQAGILYPKCSAYNVEQIDLDDDREEAADLRPQKVKKIRKRNKVGLKYLEGAHFDEVKFEEKEEENGNCKKQNMDEDEDLDL